MLVKYYRHIKPIKLMFLIIALVLIIFVIITKQQYKKRFTNATIFLVDISNSMNTQDIGLDQNSEFRIQNLDGNIQSGNIQLTRLDATKNMIKQIIENNEFPQSFGLVLFSQTANYFIPPTDDTAIFLQYIDTISSNHLPFGGTNIAQSLQLLMHDNNPARTLILFSDMGENTDYDAYANQIDTIKKQLRYQKMILVGLGTLQGDVVRYADQKIVMYQGENVISKRNDDVAKILKKIFNASYYPVSSLSDTERVLRDMYPSNTKALLSQKQIDIVLPVIALLILLGL